MLNEDGILGVNPINISTALNVKIMSRQENLLSNFNKYQKLIGKLNYLIVIKHDNLFVSINRGSF